MKRLIFVFLVLVFSMGVSAAVYDVEVNPVKDVIFYGEKAVFDVTIKNLQDVNDKVTFSISDLDWGWDKKFFDIGSGGQIGFNLELTPPEDAPMDVYSLGFRIYSVNDPGNYVYSNLIVNLVDNEDLLEVKRIDYGNGLDPSKDRSILKLTMKNVYNFELNDLEVYLDSDAFSAMQTVSFGDSELKTIEFEVNVDDNSLEGDHDLRILVKKGDSIYIDEVQNVKIGQYPNLMEDVVEDYGFLTKEINVIKRNGGNTVAGDSYTMALGYFDRVFSKVSPRPDLIEKENWQYFYTWNFQLGPGDEFNARLFVNYRDPLFLLIAVIIIIYFIYYMSERGIILNKKVLTVKTTQGISQMKVLLYVKNKGKRRIKDVRIVDILHGVEKLPNEYGSLRPNKIKRRGNDVVLVWNVSLLGKEERILSYKISAETAIKAPMKLPGAMARFKIGGRQYIVKSNSNVIYS